LSCKNFGGTIELYQHSTSSICEGEHQNRIPVGGESLGDLFIWQKMTMYFTHQIFLYEQSSKDRDGLYVSLEKLPV
jgi:hypothetical protein